jgi:hypothetical protein
MPAYRYEALDAAGKSQSGLLEADNAKAARAALRGRELVPLTVTTVTLGAQDAAGARFTRRVFSATGLTVWTRQLAGLVGSGLPLERALTSLSEETENPRQRELVAHLKSEVNAGSAFARALATAPREFDDVYRAVVAAGEQSGALGPVLERLADDLEQRQALRSKVIGAMLYPAIVSLVALAIVVILLTYVVPQIAGDLDRGHAGDQRLRAAMGLGRRPAAGRRCDAVQPGPARRGFPRTQRRGSAAPALRRPPGPGLQRGAFRRHAGHAGRGRRAHPESAAGRRRNAGQPRDARRCDGRPGAGA